MNEANRAVEKPDRVGGHVDLDFVNTVDCWTDGRPGTDYLVDYDDLLRWCVDSGLIERRNLRQLGDASTRSKTAALQRARAFRATLYSLFSAIARGSGLPQPAVDELERVVRSTMSWRHMHARGRELAIDWDFAGAPADAVLGPIAWPAVELLRYGPVERIKACATADGCGWLFLDLSKNRSRTWCSMKTCGNSAKVRRYRKRR